MQMASSQGTKRNELGMKWDELDPQSCWQAHGHEIENRTRLVCVSALSHWPLVEESLLWQQREGSSSDTLVTGISQQESFYSISESSILVSKKK